MGVEYTDFDDSNSDSFENSNIVHKSSQLSQVKTESSKIVVSTGNFTVTINATSVDFNFLYKKWVDCVNLVSLDNKSSKSYTYSHLFNLNSAIKHTIRRLNNYEGVLLFSHVIHTNRFDDEFLDSLYTLVIQWYFCIKCNFRISEFPFLGSYSTFNSLIFGLRSVAYSFSRFVIKLLNSYLELEKYIYPIIGHRSDSSVSDDPSLYGDNLIAMFPVFSNFDSTSNLKEFSEEFVYYLFDLNFSSSRKNIPFNYDDSMSILDDLWSQLDFDPLENKDLSEMKVYLILLDIYSDISFNNGMKNSELIKLVDKIIDVYSKWLRSMNSNKSELNEGEYTKSNVNDETVLVKQENGQDTFGNVYKYDSNSKLFDQFRGCVVLSCSKFVEYYFNLVENTNDKNKKKYLHNFQQKVVQLMDGLLEYGTDKRLCVCKDLVILDGNSSLENIDSRAMLQLSLLRIEILNDYYNENVNEENEDKDNKTDNTKNNSCCYGNMKSKYKSRYYRCEEPFETKGVSYTIKSSYEKVCEFCRRFYSSIGEECGLNRTSEGFKINFSTTLTTNVDSSYTYYDFPKELAKEFLDELCKVIDKKNSSVSSILINNEKDDNNISNKYSNNNKIDNDYNNNIHSLINNNSAMYCCVMAIASLMDDDIYLDSSEDKVVGVIVSFRSIYRYNVEVFELILKLVYLEICDDSIMTIEYRNYELSLYRTMLIRYLVQLSMSPINTNLKIRLDLKRSVDFKVFIMRLFKYLNFRTNYMLMDRVVFEKYLTTRVIRSKKAKENDNINNENKMKNNGKDKSPNDIFDIDNEYNDDYKDYYDYEYQYDDLFNNRGDNSYTEYLEEADEELDYQQYENNSDELNNIEENEYHCREEQEEGMYRLNDVDKTNDGITINDTRVRDGRRIVYDIPLDDIMNSFGFLEYCGGENSNGVFKINIKSGDLPKNELFFNQEYFFNLFFKFIGVLRYFKVSDTDYIDGDTYNNNDNYTDMNTNLGSDLVDQFSFKYYLRLCSNDFYDPYNTSVIYSTISKVIDTNEYGLKTDNTVFVRYFGEEKEKENMIKSKVYQNKDKDDSPNDIFDIEDNVNDDYYDYNSEEYMDNNYHTYEGYVDKYDKNRRKVKRMKQNKTKGGNSFINVPMINLLKLNNRYTKRSFYNLTYMFCNEFFRYVPMSGVSTLLCIWASSLPTDSTSTVKNQKIATARYLAFMLISRICSIEIDMSKDMFNNLETLISSINVIFVNLEIIYRQPSTNPFCEVISSDEEFSTPKPCDIVSQELDLTNELNEGDIEFYDKIVNNYKAIKTANIKRYYEKRNNIRAKNKKEVQLLLQVSYLLSRILDNICEKLHKIVSNTENGFLTESNDFFMVYCVGLKRTLFYSVMDLLDLVDNTISATIRACILSTLNLTDEELVDDLNIKSNNVEYYNYYNIYRNNIKSVKSEQSEYNTPVHTKSQLVNNMSQTSYNTNKGNYCNNNSNNNENGLQNTPKTPNKMNENSIYSEMIAKIKSHKNNIKSRLNILSKIPYPDETVSSPKEIYSWDSAEGIESVFYDVDEMPQESLEDDLDDFIDFDTDKHLSMLTYDSQNNNIKNRKGFNVNKKLKLTNLRNEWKFIIKSHLI